MADHGQKLVFVRVCFLQVDGQQVEPSVGARDVAQRGFTQHVNRIDQAQLGEQQHGVHD